MHITHSSASAAASPPASPRALAAARAPAEAPADHWGVEFAAPATSPTAPPALHQLDWSLFDKAHRSEKGRYGVIFGEVDGIHVAVKVAPDLRREVLATELAAWCGLRTPVPFHLVEPPPPMDLREICDALPQQPVVVMLRLRGVSFSELTPAVEAMLQRPDAAGEKLIFQLGEIYAFDCFIGNDDRFPRPLLGSHNRGNVMVTAAGLICIDNTLGSPANLAKPAYRAQWTAHLQDVVTALGQPPPPEPPPCFVPWLRFFPPELEISWAAVAAPFYRGLQAGMQRLTRLAAAALDHRLAATDLDAPSRKFLRTNLAQLQAATPLSLPR